MIANLLLDFATLAIVAATLGLAAYPSMRALGYSVRSASVRAAEASFTIFVVLMWVGFAVTIFANW